MSLSEAFGHLSLLNPIRATVASYPGLLLPDFISQLLRKVYQSHEICNEVCNLLTDYITT